jgi:hypothetical protein
LRITEEWEFVHLMQHDIPVLQPKAAELHALNSGAMPF